MKWIVMLMAAFVVGCATTDQRTPTAQSQPQSQKQKDEQWADLRVVATVNNYIGAGAKKPAHVDGETATEATPGSFATGEGEAQATVHIENVNLSVTVSTHGQSEKDGAQSGGSQGSNVSQTATPTNDVRPETTVTPTGM